MYATIENYNPYVPCGAFSYTWVMLTKQYAAYRWAQFGPSKACQGLTMHAQYAETDSSSVTDVNWTILPDVRDEYKVTYNPSTGQFRWWVNGINKLNHTMAWVPNVIMVDGELNRLDAQMMGDSSNKEEITAIFERENGGWFQIPSGSFNQDAHFGLSGNYTSFSIWDLCP